MLYGIALEIAVTEIKAEEILIKTFRKVRIQTTQLEIPDFQCMALIKLLIQTAREELQPGEIKPNFKLRQFEKTPFIHQLLCGHTSMEEYCRENNITREDALKHIRSELNSLRTNLDFSALAIH